MFGPVSKAASGSVPRASAIPAGGSTGVRGAVGKSRVIEPSSWGVALRTPLRVANRTGPLWACVVCRTVVKALATFASGSLLAPPDGSVVVAAAP